MLKDKKPPRKKVGLVVFLVVLLSSVIFLGCQGKNMLQSELTDADSEDSENGIWPTITPTSAPPPPVVVDLTQSMDSQGVLKEDIQIISSDRNATLNLKEGTLVLDASRQPVESLSIRSINIQPKKTDYYQAGWSYSIEPEGVTFDPPANLTLQYSAEDLPPEPYINPRKPMAGRYDQKKDSWEKLDMTADVDQTILYLDIKLTEIFCVIFRLNYPVPLS